jgi:polyphosphate kinase
MKLNSLVDPELIEALYDASQAGARVDLIVRGICCLRPGVPGLSETIRVRSIVGRHLEHSRIFRFGVDGDATYFLGSADLMERNLDRRVEVLSPVRAPALKAQFDEILETLEADDALAWELDQSGRWRRVSRNGSLNAQIELEHNALERARRITAI